MSDALRMEVKKFGIDVVIIEPGAVQTGFEKVAFAKLASTPHATDYQPIVEGFSNYATNMYKRSPDPEGTADAIVTAATATRPRIRYRTTLDAKVLPLLKRLVGDRFSGWLTIRQLG